MSDSYAEKESKVLEPVEGQADGGEPGQITAEVLLDPNGFKLFPQPVRGDDLDPLNWTSFQKHVILSIVMAL
jgi:hypothetical protein